ncbi:hypothetical protein DDB_G0280885 [Dictyostelium discoideum AX4]|uniref:Uncharacterized protein n=1 Tax=Dictyostelium discoideum TaxID=44689 RepID=Q54UQ8_DICDI|nr:hypothetical protein DDB_G0280885 [Dictyostelium discoideum AX4]EAL66984.1 hypothetical protein DDB_G0280885 [Dictyostelium discoideum AX4]|eukprot:XP_640963.1 hypothetical protein DDB_G0280885 [Dictyostelium discoideum AX4]
MLAYRSAMQIITIQYQHHRLISNSTISNGITVIFIIYQYAIIVNTHPTTSLLDSQTQPITCVQTTTVSSS